ncbi:MAG: hypothetical protein LH618_20215, partial [Saprospiraceae bacterium]|nr:hypothetical protein [Saprospiraceae bacterium]
MCKKDQSSTTIINNKTQLEMPTPAQPLAGAYPDDWKIVDSLERQGLYKSALEKVEAIQARARADQNSPQAIKALLFRGKYTTMLEEDGLTKAMQTFEDEIKTAPQPERAVLQSMLGQLYTMYLQNQAWKIQRRTPIPDGEGGDVLTWSAAQIERHALDLYAASLEDEKLLQSTPVENFRDITTASQGDTVNGQVLRPTLYDLLAHRALAQFSNERNYLTEPAYKFELDAENAFAPAADFVKIKFTSPDSTSGKLLAINLFQRVLTAHLADRDPSALIDADLVRLQLVRNNSVREDKDRLYENALET